MSANLDLVRSIYAAWERGDFSSTEWAHPEIEFVIGDGPDAASSTGVAGMGEAFRKTLNAWEDYRVHADEYREIDDERVLVFPYRSGRGKTSGLEVGQLRAKGATVFHFREDKVTRLVVYSYFEHAVADLGLAAEGGSEA
jgi:ketosteroid isomerase-like protein